ncbi:MAG: ribonuclease T2 [Burkholderiales bacterium]|nr:ribonuclease T2 [Burkholderiales bacterium]
MVLAGNASAASFDYYLLAASWQPGFCATHPGKPECTNLVGTYAATNFDLHGLWPNAYDGNHPFYCGVSQTQINLDTPTTWCSMANYGASSSTMNNLAMYMPGVQSCLDKHEWYKHGSCANATPDTYWASADSLISRLNTTSFANFVRNNQGKNVSRSQLLSAFGSAFGSGSTAAVALQCTKYNGVSYFTEAWINLDQTRLSSFPANSSLVLDGAITGTCPGTNIYITKAK